MSNQITPVLNLEQLQEKANEFAMEGFTKYMKEYYTSYNSPYQKALDEHFKDKTTSVHFEIPDIVGVLNDMISTEVDNIANTAVLQTFLPAAKRMLTRISERIFFSEILRKFISDKSIDSIDDCEVSVNEDDRYHWLNVDITGEHYNYHFTLHLVSNANEPKKYKLMGLPYDRSSKSQTMSIQVEGAKIEMPFTGQILHDQFLAYMASLVISGPQITMDTTEFDYEMFPDRCHC